MTLVFAFLQFPAKSGSMNLILVNSLSHKQKLAASDRRSEHIRSILGNRVSEGLFVGFRDGHMGKARVTILENGDVELEIESYNFV